MIRFTIRDVLWLTVVVGMGVMLVIQHQKADAARKRVATELQRNTNIDFVQMPLSDAAVYLSMMHRVPVFFSDEVNEDVPVTAKFTNTPLRDALEGILPPLG